MTGTTIVIALIVLGVVLFFAWPAFRQFLRIRAGNAVGKGTTAVERNKDRYKQLKAELPIQRENVAQCMATVDDVTKDLTDAEAAVGAVQNEYKTAKELNASEGALDSLGKQFDAAEAKVTTIKGRLALAKTASDEAQNALDSTVESLKTFADKIQDSELAAQLTSAINISAKAKQQAKDINDKLSEAAEDFDSVEHDLNVARNKAKLGDGSAADRELADLKKKAAAKSGRSKLDALTTPPASDKPQG